MHPRRPGPGPLQVLSECLPRPAGLGGGPLPGDDRLQAKAFLSTGFGVGGTWAPTSTPSLTVTSDGCLCLCEASVSLPAGWASGDPPTCQHGLEPHELSQWSRCPLGSGESGGAEREQGHLIWDLSSPEQLSYLGPLEGLAPLWVRGHFPSAAPHPPAPARPAASAVDAPVAVGPLMSYSNTVAVIMIV